jgi:mRNA interferase MazF
MQIYRGEIWSVRWTGYAEKARPALVVQSVKYLKSQSDIMALVTSDESGDRDLRIPICANSETGLEHDSFVCLDKIMAIPLDNLGEKIGEVSDEFMDELDIKLIRVLGIGKGSEWDDER